MKNKKEKGKEKENIQEKRKKQGKLKALTKNQNQ